MEERAMLEKIAAVVEKANVNAVFGAPQTAGDVTVIPYAEVACGFGMGIGSSVVTVEDECCCGEGKCHCGEGECHCDEGKCDCGEGECHCEESACCCDEAPASTGGGGGAGMRVRPLGYIEISPVGTTIKPIVDEHRLAMAGILLGAWAIAWLGLVLKAIFGRR